MRKLLILMLLVIASISYTQTKYMIYFKDKGIQPVGKVSASSEVYRSALGTLSERAVERRKKVMGNDIVKYEDIPIRESYISDLENIGIKVINRLKWFNAVSAYLSDDQLNEVKKLNFVDKIEEVHIFKRKDSIEKINPAGTQKKINKVNSFLEYGPSFEQYALSNIPLVHKAGITGNGVLIGLLDSGFRWRTHESLQNTNVLAEHDFIFNDDVTSNQPGDVTGQDGHGTYVFSVVGGNKPGQIIGSAYGAQFILAKTENIASETHVEEDNYAAALEWMEGQGVDVTSGSLGYNEFDAGQTSYTFADMNGNTTIVTKAANLAFERGIVTVTSAGNEGNNAWQYITAPADAFHMIAVGAVTSENERASFSSLGPTYDRRIKPDVVAQGVMNYGADEALSDAYYYSQGTSYAAPIVSGITGLLLSAYPHLTNLQVFNIVHMAGDNWATPDSLRGYGLLLADKAIEYPNLEESNGSYILHKAFLDSLIQPGTAKVFYSVDNDINFTSLDLNHVNGVFYNVGLPGLSNGQKIKMYFTYTNINGQEMRSPDADFYGLVYGNNNIVTSIDENNNTSIPEGYTLYQNYPNPFNNSTIIEFYSPEKGSAELTIYNLLGQQIKQYNLIAETGKNSVSWNAANSSGIINSSGVYFYVLKIAGNTFTRKMILLR